MTGSSILFTPDFGYAGVLTRPSHSTVEPVVMSTDKPFAGDGLMGKKVAGKFVPISEGDAVTVFFGIRVRSYPFMSDSDLARQLTTPYNHTGDALTRGYIAVKVNAGTVADNAPVFVRVKAGTKDKPIGGFEAEADKTEGNTVALANARFIGAADANGIAEVAFNI